MKSKSLSNVTLCVLGCFGVVLVFLSMTSPSPISLIEASEVVALDAPAEHVGLPIRLSIPKLAIDTTLIYVGLTSEGALDAPTNPDDAGWFEFGPRPGEEGSAVIDGHYGWKDGLPAIFDNLSDLRTGDSIFVEDENGAVITFVVRGLHIYGPTDDAYEVFNSHDRKSHLNLITCGGSWSKTEKSYSERLVVFADKVE